MLGGSYLPHRRHRNC